MSASVCEQRSSLRAACARRYRCFIYQRFDQGGGKQGFHVVQSGDSTCQGLQSVHVGHKVMNLTTGEWCGQAPAEQGRCAVERLVRGIWEMLLSGESGREFVFRIEWHNIDYDRAWPILLSPNVLKRT